MSKIVLIGGGGHCKSVIDVVKNLDYYDEIVITDPLIEVGNKINGCEVLGSDDCLYNLRNNGYKYAFITVGSVGSNNVRKMLMEKIKSFGFELPVIIDPSAVVARSSRIEEGTFIGKNVVINSDVIIGANSIINTASIIEHDCVIGNFTHVSVGAIICGGCNIGDCSFIGAGTTVIQGINIGDNVTIGANSTVLNDVENNLKRYGIV